MDDHEAMELQIAKYQDALKQIQSYFTVMGTPTGPQLVEIERITSAALAYDPRDEERLSGAYSAHPTTRARGEI